MMRYVKLLDDNRIKEAPTCIEGISNFNSSPELMIKHEYYPLISDEYPSINHEFESYEVIYKTEENEDNSLFIHKTFKINKLSLDIIKNKQCEKINNERNKREIQPIMVGVDLFDSDSLSVQRMQVVLTSLTDGMSIPWTLANNKIVMVDKMALLNVLQSITLRVNEIFIYARKLKDQILASDDWDYVANVKWGDEIIES